MTLTNQEVAQRWFEQVWNQRNTAVVNELLNDDSICHGEGGDIVGKDEFRKRLYEPMVGAFPDLRVAVEAAIVQDQLTVLRWVGTGTHTGSGLGIPPTGQPVEIRGMTWLRIEGGKLSEGWQYSNISEVVRGLTP